MICGRARIYGVGILFISLFLTSFSFHAQAQDTKPFCAADEDRSKDWCHLMQTCHVWMEGSQEAGPPASQHFSAWKFPEDVAWMKRWLAKRSNEQLVARLRRYLKLPEVVTGPQIFADWFFVGIAIPQEIANKGHVVLRKPETLGGEREVLVEILYGLNSWGSSDRVEMKGGMKNCAIFAIRKDEIDGVSDASIRFDIKLESRD